MTTFTTDPQTGYAACDNPNCVRDYCVGQRLATPKPIEFVEPETPEIHELVANYTPYLPDRVEELEAQVRALEAQVEENGARLVADLRAEHRREIEALYNKGEQLKYQVVETALEVAEDHGWCGVVEDALRDMGLGDYIPVQEFEVVVVVEHRVRVAAVSRSIAQQVTDRFLRDSVSVSDSGEIEFDGDFDGDFEVLEVGISRVALND